MNFSRALTAAFFALGLSACATTKPDTDVPPPAAPAEQGDEAPAPAPDPAAGGDDASASAELLVPIYFGFDSTELTPEARETLTELKASLDKNAAVRLQIEGHCDERGTAEYNLALGDRRAQAAFAYLKTLGVEPNRLSTISYGKEKPAVEGETDDALAKNRRGEFKKITASDVQ